MIIDREDEYKKIGGFLYIILIFIVWSLLGEFKYFSTIVNELKIGNNTAINYFNLIFLSLSIIFKLFILLPLFFSKRKQFPKLLVFYFSLYVLYTLFFLVLVLLNVNVNITLKEGIIDLIKFLIFLVVIVIYFKKSKRVKQTFVV